MQVDWDAVEVAVIRYGEDVYRLAIKKFLYGEVYDYAAEVEALTDAMVKIHNAVREGTNDVR